MPFLIAQSLDLWQLNPNNIVLEVIESGFLTDEEFANHTLTQLISLGCKIALDDFGTGYSSMLRLRDMPVHLVKIDQSFIRNVAESDQDAAIVRAIISLCGTFGKEVIAEGIENEACLEVLTKMQCQKLQGYFYSKPLPQAAFTQWFTEFSQKTIPSKL